MEKLEQCWSVHKIAINQTSTSSEIVIDKDYSAASFPSLLNDLSNKMVINLSEKSQISDRLKNGKLSAIQKLLAVLQDKKEGDVAEFIKVLLKNKMASLAVFMEEIIEKVKRVKKTMDTGEEMVNMDTMDYNEHPSPQLMSK